MGSCDVHRLGSGDSQTLVVCRVAYECRQKLRMHKDPETSVSDMYRVQALQLISH